MFNLPHVPTTEELIDKAFREGSKVAKKVRDAKRPRNKEIRIRIGEEKRAEIISRIICSILKGIIEKFPSYDQMPKFYQKLLDIKVDKNRYKKSLGALQWCIKNIKKVKKETLVEIKKYKNLNATKKFLGRLASLIKQISFELENLIEIKKILNEFPKIEKLPTLVIAGYPNVGKSTFLRMLTGAKVKVASYPFTTQRILIAYKNFYYRRYQIIDTPGLFDRPLEKRNKIELQAILALEELADKIIFIFDPTQEIEPQSSLLQEIEKNFKKEIFIAINKKDIAKKEKIEEIKKKLDDPFFVITANNKEECEKVFERIFSD